MFPVLNHCSHFHSAPCFCFKEIRNKREETFTSAFFSEGTLFSQSFPYSSLPFSAEKPYKQFSHQAHSQQELVLHLTKERNTNIDSSRTDFYHSHICWLFVFNPLKLNTLFYKQFKHANKKTGVSFTHSFTFFLLFFDCLSLLRNEFCLGPLTCLCDFVFIFCCKCCLKATRCTLEAAVFSAKCTSSSLLASLLPHKSISSPLYTHCDTLLDFCPALIQFYKALVQGLCNTVKAAIRRRRSRNNCASLFCFGTEFVRTEKALCPSLGLLQWTTSALLPVLFLPFLLPQMFYQSLHQPDKVRPSLFCRHSLFSAKLFFQFIVQLLFYFFCLLSDSAASRHKLILDTPPVFVVLVKVLSQGFHNNINNSGSNAIGALLEKWW